MSAKNETKTECEAAPMPRHMLYRVTVERTTVERREFIVYADGDYDAMIQAEENELCFGASDFVLHDDDWSEAEVSDEREVEELPHELPDYAPEIGRLNLDARIAADREGTAAGYAVVA